MKYKLMFLISITFFLLYGCTEDSIENEQMPESASMIEEVESVTESIPTMENEANNNSELVSEEIVQPTSEFEEVEDIEVIKEKALVAYQEYINSDEMLEYATPTGEPDRRYLTKYLIWDINGDEIPEFHLNNSREYFIYEYSVEEDKAVLWKTFYPNLNLRQDNVLIYQWGDSTPEGWEIIFQCFTLDQNGDKEEIAYLKMCDANNDGKYDETDIYALDSQTDCMFGEWKSVAEQYLEFNADGIIVEKELQYLDLVEWTVYCEAK